MDIVRRLAGLLVGATGSPEPSAAATATTTVAVTLSLLCAAHFCLYPVRRAVIPGPLGTSMPRLSKAAAAALVYRPDMYPGARDVSTPVRELCGCHFHVDGLSLSSPSSCSPLSFLSSLSSPDLASGAPVAG